MADQSIHEKRGIKFDATINLGHILTFIGFLIAGFISWSTVDKRIVVLEEARLTQAQINAKQDLVIDESKKNVSDGFNRVNDKLDRLLDKIIERK